MKNWKEDKAYQKKQAERLVQLKAKDGYEANLERGIVEKEEAKKNKQRIRKVRLAKLNKREVKE